MFHPATAPRPSLLPARLAAPVLATIAMVGGLLAQDIPLAAFDSISAITHGQATPDGQDPGIWGGGRNYKVCFDDGMTYYPHVGAELPHQPLHWRTLSVRAGDVELLAVGELTPAPHVTTTRCDYDFGAVTERYDLQKGGLEQSFVVRERPAAGDLVIRGVLTTPLQVESCEAQHGGLALRLADGRQVIDYGAAFAVDAAGRRTAITTACDGSTVTMRVPAAVVASASFPLVIDPLLGNVLLEGGAPIADVDVLYETVTPASSSAGTWIAYTRTVAAGDHDIWIKRCGSNFTGALIDSFEELSFWDIAHCQLALAPGAARVVTVFSVDNGLLRTIGVHRHDTADLALNVAIDFPFFAAGTCNWRPDIGGQLGPTGNKMLIVFQRENVNPFANTATSTVYATVYDATLSGVAALVVPPFVVNVLPNADQERPVCNQAAAGNHWLVAFQQNNGNIVNDDWDVLAFGIDEAGTVSPSPVTPDQTSNPLLHCIAPQIAGAAGRYLLTYTTRLFELTNPKPLVAEGDSLWAQRIDWDHATNVGSKPHAAVLLQGSAGNDLRAESIAFDSRSASHWEVASSDAAAQTFGLRRLGYNGHEVESLTYSAGATTSLEAVAMTFDAGSRQFPMVLGENSTTGSAGFLKGNVVRYVPVLPPTTIGVSCGSGVWSGLTATGDRQQIGSQAMPLQLSGVPVDLLSFLMISTGQINVSADPLGATGCTIVPDIGASALIGILTANVVGGQSNLTLDLPEFLTPFTVYLQWGYLVPGANPAGMQASEGLRIRIDR